jgi:hypothetical protein
MKLQIGSITLSKNEARPVPIVNDAGIAVGGLGEGRLIPLVIVDTTGRSDIDELMRIHEHLDPGDATSQWIQLAGHSHTISLVLHFVRPAALTLIVEFDLSQRAGLVDQIISVGAVYIQAGRPGDRFISTMESLRILVEIPDTGVREIWNNMFKKETIRKMRADGLNRADAKRAAQQFIDEWRKFGRRVTIRS